MLSQQLIKSALALTGKIMEDMYETIEYKEGRFDLEFSIEKFCYYLLSEGFIDKYPGDINEYISDIPYAIMHYQSGNEESITKLLTKIKGQ